jgi:hypothetical protein
MKIRGRDEDKFCLNKIRYTDRPGGARSHHRFGDETPPTQPAQLSLPQVRWLAHHLERIMRKAFKLWATEIRLRIQMHDCLQSGTQRRAQARKEISTMKTEEAA